jgi:hypothetical protein
MRRACLLPSALASASATGHAAACCTRRTPATCVIGPQCFVWPQPPPEALRPRRHRRHRRSRPGGHLGPWVSLVCWIVARRRFARAPSPSPQGGVWSAQARVPPLLPCMSLAAYTRLELLASASQPSHAPQTARPGPCSGRPGASRTARCSGPTAVRTSWLRCASSSGARQPARPRGRACPARRLSRLYPCTQALDLRAPLRAQSRLSLFGPAPTTCKHIARHLVSFQPMGTTGQ